MQLPVRVEEGDLLEIAHGRERYLYEVEEVEDVTFTITSLNFDDQRGTFDVHKHEVMDMLNGSDSASVIR